MTKDEIKSKYTSVGSILDDALNKAQSVQINGEEENHELTTIISTLDEINTEFKAEIEELEASSEWDKFCVAFFGETNAGKSTIIESLRIIFDEEQRKIERAKQEEEYTTMLSSHCDDFQALLQKLKEINNSLCEHKETNSLIIFLRGIGLVLLGLVVGYAISFFGLL